MSANRGNSKGACILVVSELLVLIHAGPNLNLPGGRHLHRKERHYVYKGKGLPVLFLSVHVKNLSQRYLHRLKLVTGVEISTRPVNSTGSEGNAKNRNSLRAAAEAKSASFRFTMSMATQRYRRDSFMVVGSTLHRYQYAQNRPIAVTQSGEGLAESCGRVKFPLHIEPQIFRILPNDSKHFSNVHSDSDKEIGAMGKIKKKGTVPLRQLHFSR